MCGVERPRQREIIFRKSPGKRAGKEGGGKDTEKDEDGRVRALGDLSDVMPVSSRITSEPTEVYSLIWCFHDTY